MVENTQVKIKQFNLDLWNNRSLNLIFSDRSDRHSENLCHHLIDTYNQRHEFPDISIVITMDPDYMDNPYKYERYDTELIAKIITRQKALQMKGIEGHILLLIDDPYLSFDRIKNDHNLEELFINGRHYNITTLIKIPYEYPTDTAWARRSYELPNLQLAPKLRVMPDFIWFFATFIGANRSGVSRHRRLTMLHRNFFSDQPFEVLDQIDQTINGSDRAIVRDNRRDDDQSIQWYHSDHKDHIPSIIKKKTQDQNRQIKTHPTKTQPTNQDMPNQDMPNQGAESTQSGVTTEKIEIT